MRHGKVKKEKRVTTSTGGSRSGALKPSGKATEWLRPPSLHLTSYPVLRSRVMPIQRAIGCAQVRNQPIVPDTANRDRVDGHQLFLPREILRGRRLLRQVTVERIRGVGTVASLGTKGFSSEAW
jgi:hypothetical protein